MASIAPTPPSPADEQRVIPSNPVEVGQGWPKIIIGSTLATVLVTFVLPDIFLRPLIVFWFICSCPGMTLVPYFHLRDKTTAWTLVLALSFTIDALIAAIQLYARIWSPPMTLMILLALCLVGSIFQQVPRILARPALTKQKRHTAHAHYRTPTLTRTSTRTLVSNHKRSIWGSVRLKHTKKKKQATG